MNEIKLSGYLEDIRYSHTVNDIIYDKATLIVPRIKGEHDTLDIRFKRCSAMNVPEGKIQLTGTLRSYSKKLSETKNKVEIYVFTYFDSINSETSEEITNKIMIDGRICKKETLHQTKSGKNHLNMILANNLFIQDKNIKLNNYIPIVFWGRLVQRASQLNVGDQILIKDGQLHSRTYVKKYPNGEVEIKTAQEVVVLDYESII